MKRLVISPHMDDESMGCGGLLAKYGPECLVLNVAGSGQVREREHAAAMEILGVTNVRNLDYPDGYVHDHMARLVAETETSISGCFSRMVFTTVSFPQPEGPDTTTR